METKEVRKGSTALTVEHAKDEVWTVKDLARVLASRTNEGWILASIQAFFVRQVPTEVTTS